MSVTVDGTVDTPAKQKNKLSAHRFRQLRLLKMQLTCCYLARADLANRNTNLAAYFYLLCFPLILPPTNYDFTGHSPFSITPLIASLYFFSVY